MLNDTPCSRVSVNSLITRDLERLHAFSDVLARISALPPRFEKYKERSFKSLNLLSDEFCYKLRKAAKDIGRMAHSMEVSKNTPYKEERKLAGVLQSKVNQLWHGFARCKVREAGDVTRKPDHADFQAGQKLPTDTASPFTCCNCKQSMHNDPGRDYQYLRWTWTADRGRQITLYLRRDRRRGLEEKEHAIAGCIIHNAQTVELASSKNDWPRDLLLDICQQEAR